MAHLIKGIGTLGLPFELSILEDKSMIIDIALSLIFGGVDLGIEGTLSLRGCSVQLIVATPLFIPLGISRSSSLGQCYSCAYDTLGILECWGDHVKLRAKVSKRCRYPVPKAF